MAEPVQTQPRRIVRRGARGPRLALVAVLVAGGAVLVPGVATAAPVSNNYTSGVIELPPGTYFRPASTGGNPVNGKGLLAGTTRVGDFERAAVLNTRTNEVYALPTLGGSTSNAYDINNGSYVVGRADNAAGKSRPFLWLPYNGRMIDLGTLGGDFGIAYALSDKGVIVGEAATASGDNHAFRRDPATGVLQDLGTLGGPYSAAFGVNNSGNVVGWAYATGSGAHAFFWDSATATMRDIGTLPGTVLSRAADINDSNVVVGDAFTPADDSNRPFIWGPHLSRPTALPGSFAWGMATAISRDGTVVGEVHPTAPYSPRAAIWFRYGRDVSELSTPGGPPSSAFAIDKANRVFGLAADPGQPNPCCPTELVRWDPPA